jgi:hypothetical protein
MRALLIVLGIFVLIGGLCITVISAFLPAVTAVTGELQTILEDVGELETRYCNAGERLEIDETNVQSTPGSTTFTGLVYCVDQQTNRRRDVSGEFSQDFTQDFTQNLTERFQSGEISFTPNPLACAVPLVGLGLILAGIFMRGGGSRPQTVGVPVTTYNPPPGPRPAAPVGGNSDLARQLEQLDVARTKGLITQEEYDRKRQQLLDNLK